MIPQIYIIVLPTVTFCLANLLVSYRISFFLFFIRAPNPVSGPESTVKTPHSVSYRISFFLCFIRAWNPVSGPESGFGPRIRFQGPNPVSGLESTVKTPYDTLRFFHCTSYCYLLPG